MLINKVTIEGKRFLTGDQEIWMNGVNTPWQNWDDFGDEFDPRFWDVHYKELHQAGINCSRVWITCSGDVGVEIDERGYVSGATKKHWEDIDALFQAAERNDIYLMVTLMSFDNFKDENEKYLRWRAMVQDETNRESYVQNYVIPFCQKFAHYNSLWSIDLCNEPDWVFENEECGKIDCKHFGSLFAREAAAIHKSCDVQVTIGYAVVKYNSESYFGDLASDAYLQSCFADEKAYVDFYSTHYYEWMAPVYGVPFDKTPEAFGISTDKPVLLGEFPAIGLRGDMQNSKSMNTVECYTGCYQNKWQGVMAWTSNGIDICGNMENIAPAAKAVCELMSKGNAK